MYRVSQKLRHNLFLYISEKKHWNKYKLHHFECQCIKYITARTWTNDSLPHFHIHCFSTWPPFRAAHQIRRRLDSSATLAPVSCKMPLNPRLTGGCFLPPSLFCDISRIYEWIITKFSIPSKTSVWHILTQGKLVTSHTSTTNDVRVTSCFSVFFLAEMRVCGKRCHANSWRDISKWFSTEGWGWMVLANC